MDCQSTTTCAAHSYSQFLPLRGFKHPNAVAFTRSLRMSVRVRSALQEEGKVQDVKKPILSTSTVFTVAGVAATVAAVLFTLPLGPKKEESQESHETRPTAPATSVDKGKKRSKTPKIPPMPLAERHSWARGLPVIEENVAYTDLLDLHREGNLKHIIKHPALALKKKPQLVFVVLNDDRVIRTTLPALERDERFWNSWNAMNLGSFVVNAFTPPPQKPEAPWKDLSLPFWSQATKPPLSFLAEKQQQIRHLFLKRQKKKQTSVSTAQKASSTSRIEELERARKELERARLTRQEQLKNERKQRMQEEKEAKAQAMQQKEQKTREERLLEEKQAKSEKLVQQQESARQWDDFWYSVSRNEGYRFGLGIFFFWLFYRTVVVGVKKRKKDYEDRLRIEQAEEEERKKMLEWEKDMDMAEAISTSASWQKDGSSGLDDKMKEEIENNPQVQLGLRFMRSGARVRRARTKRPPKYLDLGADVKFEDVAGLGEIRRELEEIVDFFKYKEKYLRRGSKIPSGILLCGEPGTGKTLLAKAVAGEAGVNFFSISASQFVEIYVGVGASRVRALYQEARDNAPAVVFIDELDAVGRQRGLIGGSGGQERDATLNQLLTCLDGFEGKGDVITIAATNRVDILDPALVRPGRFDRKIYIPKPGARGRVEILKVHAKNKPMADDVDYNVVADVTDGMVGAQLANLLDVAALNVLRDGRTEITTDDLLDAARLEEGGHPDPRPRSEELWHKIALNEAALAVAAINFPDFYNIQLLTILPRMGEDKGAVRVQMDFIKFETSTLSRQGVLDYITLQLAPRAADELWFGCAEMCTIWADHYDNARKIARYFVFCALSDRKDIYGMMQCWSELSRYYDLDREASQVLEGCYSRALQLLRKNWTLLKEVTSVLTEQKTVKKEDFLRLVEQYGTVEKFPPSIPEIRKQQKAAFQEMMFARKKAAGV